MNLWDLAKRLCPCRCSAYIAWYDTTPARLSPAALAGAERAAHQIYPKQAPHEWLEYLPREQERRAEMRRFRAAYLIGSHIPQVVRSALLTGRYRVSACRPDGERLTLTLEDLACLTVEVAGNRLTAPGRVFDMVAVTELAPVDRVVRPVGALAAGNRTPLPGSEAVGVLPDDDIDRRKTGPKTDKKTSVIAAMKAAVEAGTTSLDALDSMAEKTLLHTFGTPLGAARTTCREARREVVTELRGIYNPGE